MPYTWSHTAGRFTLRSESDALFTAWACAEDTAGRSIDTRTASLRSAEEAAGGFTLTYGAENGLCLREELTITDGVPMARCVLSDAAGVPVETRSLTPAVLSGAQDQQTRLWRSLWTRMLCVPYDNDMWLRYEALPLRAGRRSYDLTVLFDPESREGMLIGALDFSLWKNAAVCSGVDAHQIVFRCGEANEGTHDSLPHGAVHGEHVASSPVCFLYGDDYRRLLERYGRLVQARTDPLTWDAAPFGFNSWAGLAWHLDEESFRRSARFLREELRPLGYANRGVSYVNLDACWQPIGEEGLRGLLREQHENGQLAGIYDAPFAFFGKDIHAPLPGVPGHTYEEILLRTPAGELLPRVDGAHPMDVTHPLWEAHTAWKFNRFVAEGYEYVKVDFMSHAGMEGVHHDTSVRTGREALVRGYRFLLALLDPVRVGRPFFISLSIAPLFPNGFGHARRFSCDAFGTKEDVEYVLNAQTYSWWVNRSVYAFNDPDHIVLRRAFCMDRESTEGEARARYTAAVIAGGVMMLSDDYANETARDRTRLLAGNAEVNALAAQGVAFAPVEAADAFACRAFTAEIAGRPYAALFALGDGVTELSLDMARAALPEGRWRDLWSGRSFQTQAGKLRWQSEACDALLLVWEGA